MKKTAVIYWSGTGNTEAMANAVAEGMREAGAECAVWTPADVGADAVKELDAAALGCPAMGAEELEETEFAPMFDAVKSALAGKSVGLFGSWLGRRRRDAHVGGRLRSCRDQPCIGQRHLLRSAGRRGACRLPRAGQEACRITLDSAGSRCYIV